MQRTKAILAIFTSLMVGLTVSTFFPGCQPSNPNVGSEVTDDSRSTEPPSIEIPSEEPATPAEPATETPADVPTPGEPKPEAPADAPPPKP